MGKKTGQESSACALLDSGAVGIIIDQDYATKNNLTLHTLVNPLPVKNVDGTLNRMGSVKYTTIQKIHIKTSTNDFHEGLSELYVTMLRDDDIILGLIGFMHTTQKLTGLSLNLHSQDAPRLAPCPRHP